MEQRELSPEEQREMAFYKQVHEVLGVSKEVYQSSATLRQAHKYLEDNNIHQLLENLLARAALQRPPDLRAFLAETLTEMKSQRKRPTMGVFTTEDLETMFDMWDELKVGTIPAAKVSQTLKAINCPPGREVQAVEDVVGDKQEVDKPTFMKIVRSELEKVFAPP
mmetsp:Transcript_45578/g.117831  ORF Transcript_45578/g.117831 Transcript_45578/m.117831 type:complete len:165 (+) Transcript_45578:140-634(+)